MIKIDQTTKAIFNLNSGKVPEAQGMKSIKVNYNKVGNKIVDLSKLINSYFNLN